MNDKSQTPRPRNVGNVKKIDFLMSTERDFPVRPEGAATRYVLCSTPRCGSNLVGEMLHGTGLAGDPQEYLNTRYINGFMRLRGEPEAKTLDLAAYMADLERRRTTPNGVFGVKIHFEHIDSVWKGRSNAAVKFLQRFDKFVLLSRRDKIAQAVSLYKARATQIWSSTDYQFMAEDDPRRSIKPEFDPAAIAKALKDLITDDAQWRELLTQHGLPHVELCYEDFVADYAGQGRRLLSELGIPEDKAAAGPKLKKQGADNDPLIAQFRQYIGLPAQAAAQ